MPGLSVAQVPKVQFQKLVQGFFCFLNDFVKYMCIYIYLLVCMNMCYLDMYLMVAFTCIGMFSAVCMSVSAINSSLCTALKMKLYHVKFYWYRCSSGLDLKA